jgi:uncharacterized protein YndB with AHSA1/START domain
MRTISTAHHTVVVKRTVEATAARTFAAWCDKAALERWHVPGDGTWLRRINSHDFRVGGERKMSFGAPGDVQYKEDCRYEDIVDNQRICYVMTISRGEERITTSMVTVEFFARGERTAMTVTDQLVILDGGDTAHERERGWQETLDKLPAELARRAA